MSLCSSTRSVLKALPSTIARPTQLPSSSSTSLSSLSRRPISQSSPLSFMDRNDGTFPRTPRVDSSSSSPEPSSTPKTFTQPTFAPHFFLSVLSTPSLEAALEAAEEVPVSFLSEPEQDQHRLMLRHFRKGLSIDSLEDRMALFRGLDLAYAPRTEIDARQRERARRQVEKGTGKEEDGLTMEEWDQRSEKRIEEKMKALEESDEGKREMIRKKIRTRQADARRATVLRREVRKEMEQGKGDSAKP